MTSVRRNNTSSKMSSDFSLVLMLAIAMVSFFAGTIFTAHMGLSSAIGGSLCDTSSSSGNEITSQHHRLDAKVEELAQKRLRGNNDYTFWFCVYHE